MTGMTRRESLRLLGLAAAALAASRVAAAQEAEAQKGTAQPAAPNEERTRKGSRMLTRKIPSTGETLPVIGLGSWQTFDVGHSAGERAPLEEVLKAFADLGGTLVDSSPMYGRSEAVIGDLTAKLGLRDRLFLATKVWTSGREAGIRQMEASIAKMKAGKMDLMQVHNLLDAEEHLGTLSDWKASGRIRYMGVTHYSASSHGAVAKAMDARPLDFVQINYSVGEREAEKRILPLALERGIAVIANRPFSGGDLFRRLRDRPLPGWAGEIDCSSWAQILLKFAVSHPAVTCAIPATSKVKHLRDNMGAGQGRMPDAKLRERIAREAE
jgi:aryl-alcohol dehydrogenase-like predicted oxidoreductase